MKASAIWVAATFSLVAGALWLYASLQKVHCDTSAEERLGIKPMRIVQVNDGNEVDVLATADKQTYWNARAALAASIAAVSQAISLML